MIASSLANIGVQELREQRGYMKPLCGANSTSQHLPQFHGLYKVSLDRWAHLAIEAEGEQGVYKDALCFPPAKLLWGRGSSGTRRWLRRGAHTPVVLGRLAHFIVRAPRTQ